MDDNPHFRVRPTNAAFRESNKLFLSDTERLWGINQLKLLRHWPPGLFEPEVYGGDLDYSRIDHTGVCFYELRLHDACLSQGGNLRVFFWVDEGRRTVWILHAYFKKTQRLDEVVKRRVARRIHELRGRIQDGDA